jgi:hypothetical protein
VPLQIALQIKIQLFKFFAQLKRLFLLQSNLIFENLQIFLKDDNELMG